MHKPKKHSWRIFVERGKPYYYRVYLHPSDKSFVRYYAKFKKKEVAESADAICTCPSMSDKNSNCVGEINFYYPQIYWSLFAHEFYHAVINYFAMQKVYRIVPPRGYIDNPSFAKKKIKFWSAKHERGANAMGYMMAQIHDNFIRHKVK